VTLAFLAQQANEENRHFELRAAESIAGRIPVGRKGVTFNFETLNVEL
jgi:hypothetical protein